MPLNRSRLNQIIFGSDTPAGRTFDLILLVVILLSVLVVILESVPSIQAEYATTIDVLEWIFTVIFTIEYVARIWCTTSAIRYMGSFFGIVDFLSIIPTYISLFFPASHTLLIVRALRLLRVFRILKLGRYMKEASILRTAILASREKIIVFLLSVAIILIIAAAAMYLIEGRINENFDSIPKTLYWSIVTLTTVGYGDATPITVLGKCLASVMMLIGYSMIIIPTGILTVEMSHAARRTSAGCPHCLDGHTEPGDRYCRGCGRELD
ncbi:MAG: ion transporter [Phycisphaerales bacterium]|nr:ion transporter [Phycisphaerales bacterium]